MIFKSGAASNVSTSVSMLFQQVRIHTIGTIISHHRNRINRVHTRRNRSINRHREIDRHHRISHPDRTNRQRTHRPRTQARRTHPTRIRTRHIERCPDRHRHRHVNTRRILRTHIVDLDGVHQQRTRRRRPDTIIDRHRQIRCRIQRCGLDIGVIGRVRVTRQQSRSLRCQCLPNLPGPVTPHPPQSPHRSCHRHQQVGHQ